MQYESKRCNPCPGNEQVKFVNPHEVPQGVESAGGRAFKLQNWPGNGFYSFPSSSLGTNVFEAPLRELPMTHEMRQPHRNPSTVSVHEIASGHDP